jgi:4-methylaminobutanoate oxidase (formaldehyde-forming)
LGFRIGAPVALAYLDRSLADGARVQVDIARRFFDATAVPGPLFDPEGVRMKLRARIDA